uniref:Retrovirus-related Pol polyprotein from transposon TNT 1-94 n=1 Tax=Cajanus cajan TaxID=3821 RepID=A0A151QW99_CAJCA|nr:hypothetical protein KK1_044388 [Cajanus cajan]
MQFLRGLNESFSNVRSNILMMDPLPSINKVFSYVVQQQREINNSDANLFNNENTSSSINA